MRPLSDLYRSSLALLTDLYQLSMAYGYWKTGRAHDHTVFQLSFRRQPFGGGYSVLAGLSTVLDFVENYRFQPDDLAYLEGLLGNDDRALFDPRFLESLGALKLSVDIDAIPEGTTVFPHEPLLRVEGPVLECQLLETALLNFVNFQTLIATKAARIVEASAGDPVYEFGLRRAQGVDGGLSASRAAFIGGCAGTSNVLAGKLLGIPVKGTHAHSWVMLFDTEPEAFRRYAEALPNNCVFLVDTYDTLEGVRHAIEVGAWLRTQGHELVGIRLDSGDLAYLSIEARKLLDEAGFENAVIVASNDLDERLIASLKTQNAPIHVFGVGTKLVTAYDQPALGGVYKLAAVRAADGTYEPRVKLSEQSIKVSTPGRLQVRRYETEDGFLADAIYDIDRALPERPIIVDPVEPLRTRRTTEATKSHDLLIPVVRSGARVYQDPPLAAMRSRTQTQLASLHPSVRRLDHPHLFPAGLEESLHHRRAELVLRARGSAS